MRALDDILEGSIASYQAALTEAFEAGRAIGREEAKRQLRSRLETIWSDDNEPDSDSDIDEAESMSAPQSVEEAIARQIIADTNRRAAPGSVKPAVQRQVEQHPGQTLEDVINATGFKPNSVRGTLWTLTTDGVIEKRDGRYYPSGNKEAVNVEPEGAPSTAPVEPPLTGSFRFNGAETAGEAALRPVEPVPGGGT